MPRRDHRQDERDRRGQHRRAFKTGRKAAAAADGDRTRPASLTSRPWTAPDRPRVSAPLRDLLAVRTQLLEVLSERARRRRT